MSTPSSMSKDDPLSFLETAQLTHGDTPITKENFVDYTCFFTAYMRALETAKGDDAIVTDPFAYELAGQVGEKLALLVNSKWTRRLEDSTNMMAIRTKYVDQALDQRDPSIHQVVILAAGLDSRAYRLQSLKDCHVFELDRCKRLMQYKQQIFDTKCHAKPLAKQVKYVETDFGQDQWDQLLLDQGFDPHKPTFWILEGLLYYLKQDVIVKLLKTMDQLSAPQSEFWADMCGQQALQDVSWGFASVLQYGEDDVDHGVLSLIQWTLHHQARLDRESEHFGRVCKPMKTESLQDPESHVLKWVFVMGKKPSEKPKLVQP